LWPKTGLACDNIQAIRVWRNMIDDVKAVIDMFQPVIQRLLTHTPKEPARLDRRIWS